MLENIFLHSLNMFFDREARNIRSGISERNLCGRLASILENVARTHQEFQNYYADVEYNRKQEGKIKTILDGNMNVVNISCDLIFHSRGEIIERDNLIAIEMKKSREPEHLKESDRVRLRALTKPSYDNQWSYDGIAHPEHVCGYELGYFIEVNIDRGSYSVEKFVRGNSTGTFNGNF